MKTYRNHRCTKQHRNTRTFLQCAINRIEWVLGSGQYAVVSWCRKPTVTLWNAMPDALNAKAIIDATGCGGSCTRRHELIRIQLKSTTCTQALPKSATRTGEGMGHPGTPLQHMGVIK